MSFVLIVDDHADTCRLVQRIVRRFGSEARYVHTGEEALATLSGDPPALVLLEVSIPGIGGLETLRQIRATPAFSALPVVILTAVDEGASRRRAFELGAEDFLLKTSFDLAHFRAVLARHLPLASEE